MYKALSLTFLFLVSNHLYAEENREIAITIDDLPFVAASYKNDAAIKRTHDRFMLLIQALKNYNVPATGFVIGGSIGKGEWELLEAFRNSGFVIGNHTYSHLNLNQTNPEKYIDNIDKTDKILTPLLSHPKYFRYPYLAEGKGETKEKVQQYLSQNDYKIAPVTIDSKDYRFNEELYHVPYRARPEYIPKLKQRYLTYIMQQTERAEKKADGKPVKQILLLHANLLNSYCLDDILRMYKDRGYRFITLEEALSNPAPAIVAPAADNNNPASKEEVSQNAL
jgi:peptidoglycan-N-acetylglucosamine deacetylase